MSGIVYLVGAGPGDPDLITVKGARCLQTADVVVYDRLANPVLLEWTPAWSQKIYVGKEPQRHRLDQDEINQLLRSSRPSASARSPPSTICRSRCAPAASPPSSAPTASRGLEPPAGNRAVPRERHADPANHFVIDGGCDPCTVRTDYGLDGAPRGLRWVRP
jgi:hypothetical protein